MKFDYLIVHTIAVHSKRMPIMMYKDDDNTFSKVVRCYDVKMCSGVVASIYMSNIKGNGKSQMYLSSAKNE